MSRTGEPVRLGVAAGPSPTLSHTHSGRRSKHKDKQKHGPHHPSRESEGVPIPLFPSDDSAAYALQSGITHDRRLCRHQREAYLQVQHKIGERQDKARALLISANVLSMSVMASQLVMYRWSVSEAQTVTEATAILQEEVADAERKSYRVARTRANPLHGSSSSSKKEKKTDSGGGGGAGVATRKGRHSEGKRGREGHSKYAAAIAAAAGKSEEAEAALQELFAKKVARSLRRRGTRREKEAKKEEEAAAAVAAAATGSGAVAAAEKDAAIAAYLRQKHELDSSSASSSSSSDSSSDSLESHSDEDSVCSVEDGRHGGKNADGTAQSADATPADAITRLVIVDCFTHEPFTDIMEHLRCIDREYGLELVIVLLLPQSEGHASPTHHDHPSSSNNPSGTAAAPAAGVADAQGLGMVITPQYDMSVEAAYRCGYDLVVTHYMDHVVVDFLTGTFVSSAGRWRNDVRAKAAVGNYVSLKNVLLGRIDINALKQLVWSDAVDDAELLEAIGTHSLAMQGETKHYALAGQQLSEQQQRTGAGSGNGADVLTVLDDHSGLEASTHSIFPSSLPHLRSREVSHGGVRPRSRNDSTYGGRPIPLSGLDAQRDVLNSVMNPSGSVQHVVRRRRRGPGNGNGSGDEDSNEGSLYETVLVDEATESRAVYMDAIETEMARLITENDSKQASLGLLQGELERLHKTVAVLRRKLGTNGDDDARNAPGGGGGGSGGGGGVDGHGPGGGQRAFGRPDSSSLVNLSKEQQIYILKERLEAANERIMDLVEGDDGGSGAGRRRGHSASGSRSGVPNSQGRRLYNNPTGADARRAQLQRQRKQRAMLTYHEHREAELLTLHDMDAEWLVAMQPDDSDSDGDGDGAVGRTRKKGALTGTSSTAGISDADERRREREKTDDTIHSLQEELLYLQQQRPHPGDAGDAQRRHITATKLEEALERLNTQKQRIQTLEELRRMDEGMFKRQVEQLKFAAARAASAAGDRTAAAVSKGKKAGGASKRPVKVVAGASGGGGGGGARSSAADGAGTATEKVSTQKQAARHAKELATLEERLTAAKEAAVEQERRRMRAKQRAREAAVRVKLAELYLRIRKPHTAAYRKLLEDDRARAQQEARGAWQRLHFALANTPAAAQREVDEQGVELEGPVARIADPVVRQRVALIAREHAHYSLLAQRASAALEAFDAAFSSPEEAARKAELLALRDAQQTLVEEARSHAVDPNRYLHELLQLSDTEDQLSRYAEVDCGPALTYSQAWRRFPVAVEEAERRATAATAPPSSAPTDAILATVGGGKSSSPSPSPSSTACVPLQDADGLLTCVADVFVAAAAADGSIDEAAKGGRGGSGGGRRGRDTDERGNLGRSANGSGGHEHRTGPQAEEEEDSSGDGVEQARTSKDMAAIVAAALPTRAVLSRQQDILVALRQGGASTALATLYEVLQRGFAQGYLHPDRMADVDQHVCLEGSVLTLPKATADTTRLDDDDDNEEQGRRRDGAASSPTLVAQLYLAHRQELQRLLRLLCLTDPLIVPVLAPYVNEELSRDVEVDIRRTTGTARLTTPLVTLPLLVAADTAIIASIVDLMGTAMAEALGGGDSADSEEADNAGTATLSDIMRARSLRHLAPTCEQIATYTATRAAVVDALRAMQDSRSPAGGRRGRRGRRTGSGSSSGGSVSSSTAADVAAILTRHKKYVGDDDEALLRMVSKQPTTAEYTAQDLAQMFSKRRKAKSKDGAITLEEIYLEQGVLDNNNDDDDDGGMEDENIAAIRSIRLELNYLNAARKQRMEELVLRHRLRRRARLAGEEMGREAGKASPSASTAAGEEEESREVPDFEVKSGSAAWYGMEAAKRVKDILRRRAKPGQIVVGGGPDGGGVGVELSRRTAFPPPPPREIDIMQTAQERVRAAHMALPPLKRRGLSRWQQQRYGGGGGRSDNDYGGDDAEYEEGGGYLHPRDEASLNAYGNVASQYEFDGVDRFMYTPTELTQRMLQYRATVSRAASRLGTGGNPVIASRLGPPYYTAILTGDGSSSRHAGSSTSAAAAGSGQHASPRPRPELTTLTYGVPSERVREMLASPISLSGDAADGSGTAVLFLPHRQCSSLAEQQQRREGVSSSRGNRHEEETPPRFLPPQRPPQHPPSSFLAGASASAAYTSPAALAAQHISALLRVSMADPTIGGGLGRYQARQQQQQQQDQ